MKENDFEEENDVVVDSGLRKQARASTDYWLNNPLAAQGFSEEKLKYASERNKLRRVLRSRAVRFSLRRLGALDETERILREADDKYSGNGL